MTREWTAAFAALCTSSKMAALPDDAPRLFFGLLLLQVDSYGCHTLKANVLHAKVWPLLGKPVSETERAIAACCSVGLIEAREKDGRQWLALPDWEEKAGKVIRNRGSAEFPKDGYVVVQYQCSTTAAPVQHHGNGSAAPIRTDRHTDIHTEPDIPSQTDIQTLTPERAPRAGRKKLIDPGAYPLPPEIDFPDVRSAFVDYLATRKGGVWDERLAAIRVRELAAWGRERAIAALKSSVGYMGLFEPLGSKPVSSKPAQTGRYPSREEREARAADEIRLARDLARRQGQTA